MSTLKQLVELYCPDGVLYARLDEKCELKRGTSFTKKQIEPGNVPVVAGGRAPAYFHGVSNRTGEVIVIAGSGAYAGYVSWWDIPVFVSDAFSIQSSDPNLNLRFVFHFLSSIQNQLHELKSGGGVPHVYAKDVSGIEFPFAPREVQDKIVEMLDTFAALCDNLDREIAQREQQFDRTRKQILGNLDSIYSAATLGDLADKVKTGATPKATNEKYYVDGTIPWLRTGEVRFNRINSTEVKVTEIALAETAIKWVDAPSVVVAISGATAGKSAIIEKPMTTNQHCCCLHIDDSKADYGFVYHWTAMRYEYLKSLGRGARGDLNTTIIKSLPVPVPPLDVQRDIADKLNAMQALIDNLKREREQRGQQFDYYRSQLLSFPAKNTATYV